MELTREFCERLDALVGPQLTLLASDICEQFTLNRRISGSVEDGRAQCHRDHGRSIVTALLFSYLADAFGQTRLAVTLDT